MKNQIPAQNRILNNYITFCRFRKENRNDKAREIMAFPDIYYLDSVFMDAAMNEEKSG